MDTLLTATTLVLFLLVVLAIAAIELGTDAPALDDQSFEG